MFNRMRTGKSSKGNKGKEKQGRKMLSALLATVMAVTLFTGIPSGSMEYVYAEEGVTLHNPRVTKPMVTEWEEGTPAPELKNPRTDSDGIVTWDCIYFGRYPQSDATGQDKEPIKWRVLSVNGDDAFLVADKNLDVQSYNDTHVDVTWETCTMRSWLNGYGSGSNVCSKDYSSDNFIDRAFTASEQNAIKTTTVVNADNPTYGTTGGNSTQDKVFLLSCGEVMDPVCGLTEYRTLLRKNTAYVAAGGTLGSEYMASEGSTDWWWLRSPGIDSFNAMGVNSYGAVSRNGYGVCYYDSAVCPALHLNLASSNLWRYAGTVSSDETVEYDCVYFGSYPQSDATGQEKEPIKWRVLSVNGNDAFLVADRNLDVQRYNDTDVGVTWETCTMRSWLNGYGSDSNVCSKDYGSDSFLGRAFTREEQQAIQTTTVVNADNPKWGGSGGNTTEDKLFLLSCDEVTDSAYGFDGISAAQRRNTAYVAAGGTLGSEDMASEGSTDWWWLRSPGILSSYAMIVNYFGAVYLYGYYFYINWQCCLSGFAFESFIF